MAHFESPVDSICSTGEVCDHFRDYLQAKNQYDADEANCNRNLADQAANTRYPETQSLAMELRCPYAVWATLSHVMEDEGSNA